MITIIIFCPSNHLIHYIVLQFTQVFKTKLCAVYTCVSLHALCTRVSVCIHCVHICQFTYTFKESRCQVNTGIHYYYRDIILSDNYQLPLPVTMYVELTPFTQPATSMCSAVVAQVMSNDTCHTVQLWHKWWVTTRVIQCSCDTSDE